MNKESPFTSGTQRKTHYLDKKSGCKLSLDDLIILLRKINVNEEDIDLLLVNAGIESSNN